ncbi:uncharacterized protein RSE6_03085 [Rhynchosporium secalis]|uniref:Uncharacterized protein n=1 Tax=Rhynchosporium secalis TaxID=38038 RepID=A0A1E1M1Z3_RHYSE|nr:uncharacterized protein RSE6_03085 [Rhynchosporium secalis]
MGSQDQGCRTGDEDERRGEFENKKQEMNGLLFCLLRIWTSFDNDLVLRKQTSITETLRPYYLEPGDRERDRIASLDGSTHVHRAPSQFMVLWGCGFPRLPPPSQTDSSQADSAESSIGQATQAVKDKRLKNSGARD